jgi:ubiquitin-like protein Pup
MAAQDQQEVRPADDHGDDDAPAPVPSAAAQSSDSDVDDLLDDIDGVLVANAESFVRGFVQKGGQ